MKEGIHHITNIHDDSRSLSSYICTSISVTVKRVNPNTLRLYYSRDNTVLYYINKGIKVVLEEFTVFTLWGMCRLILHLRGEKRRNKLCGNVL